MIPPKTTCHLPPRAYSESHVPFSVPFSVQLFVTLQLWKNVEQEYIVRGLEVRNQKIRQTS